jgi:two-component system, chemotaxis family, CheB/CheR fusion protein
VNQKIPTLESALNSKALKNTKTARAVKPKVAAQTSNQLNNQEIQGLNKELETAKKELELRNDKLRTINDEINERNTELRILNEDHLNFQASVEIGIVTVGADLTVRRFTPQAEITLGMRSGDIGQPIWQVRHSLETVNLQALIMTVIASDSPTDLEVQDQDGCWFLLRVRPYRTLEGQPNGAVLVLFGIDVIKRTELERQRLQHETELIFESLKDGLIAVSHDWIVTYVNTAGARLTHLTREEILGRNFWELFPGAKDSLFETNYRKVIQEKTTLEFEAFYPALETQFEICVVPVQAGITIFFRNVTERYNSELVVAETREKLRVLAESQRRFLADAAHELRAPLAVIQGNLEVLERFPNMTVIERKDAINESAREAIRLGRLANDLLALARGDAGDGLHLERLELVPILEQTLREAAHLASGRKLEYLSLEPCTILGDADKLKQLTLILLDNALKYALEGGRVWLELKHVDNHAEIRISNTGQGISQDDLKRVFERFYRTDTSRSRQTGGTGLGLSIARWIAEQHGGTVELESELGAITTAIVRLPLV